MRGWGGDVADRHVRFVFSNEPVERLATLGERVRRALAGAGARSVTEQRKAAISANVRASPLDPSAAGP